MWQIAALEKLEVAEQHSGTLRLTLTTDHSDHKINNMNDYQHILFLISTHCNKHQTHQHRCVHYLHTYSMSNVLCCQQTLHPSSDITLTTLYTAVKHATKTAQKQNFSTDTLAPPDIRATQSPINKWTTKPPGNIVKSYLFSTLFRCRTAY